MAPAREARRAEPPREGGGQASVELIAILPALLLAVLVAAQLAIAGHALWSAGIAARAGARASHVGGDGAAAARGALPQSLRRESRVREGDGLRVRVTVPSLVPGLAEIPVEAEAALEPATDG